MCIRDSGYAPGAAHSHQAGGRLCRRALHAWISVYLDGVGWIDNIIYFDGKDWVRMDPTFAASGGGASEYVGDGSNYHDLYYY